MSHISKIREYSSKYWFYELIILYFLTRCINLMSLPIFNDESIYIDWANKIRYGYVPIFYSLYDGKPPLHFILISLFIRFFKDPLVAGRILSVFAGLFSVVSIKYICDLYFSRRVVIISMIIYIFSPMFLFYDRQALQEALLLTTSLWGIYFYLLYFKFYKIQYAVISAIFLSSAFLVKASVLVVLFPLSFYFIYKLLTVKEKQNDMFVALMVFIISYLIILIPLLSQKKFSLIFTRNDRYAISPTDLGMDTLKIWLFNMIKSVKIIFWYFNTYLISILMYIYLNFRKIKIKNVLIFLNLSIPLILVILTSRNLVDRYIVPFLLPIMIVSGLTLSGLFKKYGYLAYLFLVIPIIISLFQIFYIESYLKYSNKYAHGLDLYTYTDGFTSGYGVMEAINYLKEESKGEKRTIVGVRTDAGNPESAVMAYFLKDKISSVIPMYFDAQIIKLPIPVDFIGNTIPFYFISRDDNLGGMNEYFTEIKRFYKPNGKDSVGIYKYVKRI